MDVKRMQWIIQMSGVMRETRKRDERKRWSRLGGNDEMTTATMRWEQAGEDERSAGVVVGKQAREKTEQ